MSVEIVVDFDPAARVLEDVARRAQVGGHLPADKAAVDVIRFGRGSFDAQIRARAFSDLAGSTRPWQATPAYQGKTSPGLQAGERRIFAALLGRGAGAIARVRPGSTTVGADDLVIRQIEARTPPSNGILSTEPVVDFVTGGLGRRTEPARTRATKRTRRGIATRSASSVRHRPPVRLTGSQASFAMFWRIGYELGVWLSPEQMRSGILVPPKSIGFSRAMVGRLVDLFGTFIVTGKVVRV